MAAHPVHLGRLGQVYVTQTSSHHFFVSEIPHEITS